MTVKVPVGFLEEGNYYYLPDEPGVLAKVLMVEPEFGESLVTFLKMTTKRVNRRYYPDWTRWTEAEDNKEGPPK